MKSLQEIMEAQDRTHKEEHEAEVEMINQLQYFQCHLPERVVVI